MMAADQEHESLFDAAAGGDQEAVGQLFDAHRERLLVMIRLRLDRRLQRRVDPVDVLQDTFLTIQKKLPKYLKHPELPFFLWLRLETGQTLVDLHRFHLGAQARDVGREISLHRGKLPSVESITLAERLLGRLTTASQAAMRIELRQRVQDAINELEPGARELLVMRHFEELTNGEVAQILGISPTAAYGRYLRAVRRLRKSLEQFPGGLEVFSK
ncbi:RNA polymerase sigma factor, partial [Stieleria sp.]|uniref:RNA polymerase sigma factor n=1 Tax=Stieleria sp. TaxID=2795976 RepID=UPI0035632D3C